MYRLSSWLLRATVTLHAIMAIAQPFSMGEYLDGVIGALTWHAAIGGSLFLVTGLAGTASLVLVLQRAPLRLLVPPTVLFVAEIAQIALGGARVLAIHIPLGVAIIGASVWWAWWVWRPATARRRVPARLQAVPPLAPADTSGQHVVAR
ncbi:hypothetical protein [Knoellia koreensis]|uniref:Uncharacterized protein n=1 Tax=Knoellia koreensis TaxID=2730921 RepID=A0A849HC56_9MICO|nr:hypothetical protein [Knoellia sp. DB2414S]NNM44988.1 hypothetical protein [Knoellia sp. DB2414S]